MHQHKGTQDYLTTCRAEWEKPPEGDEKSRVQKEFFLARFDPANYTKTPQGDGKVLVTMKWPPHLQEIADESEGDGKRKMVAL